MRQRRVPKPALWLLLAGLGVWAAAYNVDLPLGDIVFRVLLAWVAGLAGIVLTERLLEK